MVVCYCFCSLCHVILLRNTKNGILVYLSRFSFHHQFHKILGIFLVVRTTITFWPCINRAANFNIVCVNGNLIVMLRAKHILFSKQTFPNQHQVNMKCLPNGAFCMRFDLIINYVHIIFHGIFAYLLLYSAPLCSALLSSVSWKTFNISFTCLFLPCPFWTNSLICVCVCRSSSVTFDIF